MKFHLILIAFIFIGYVRPGDGQMNYGGQASGGSENEIMEKVGELKENIKEECRRATGSDLAYESIKDKPDELVSCIKSKINFEDLQYSFGISIQNENYDDVIDKSCKTLRNIFPCIETFSKSLEVCTVDEDSKKLTALALKIMKSLLNYLCTLKSEDFKAVFEATQDECLTSKGNNILSCAETSFKKYADENPEVVQKNVLNILTKEENCVDLVAFETCSVTALNVCENKRAINFARGVVRTIVNETPCSSASRITNSFMCCLSVIMSFLLLAWESKRKL